MAPQTLASIFVLCPNMSFAPGPPVHPHPCADHFMLMSKVLLVALKKEETTKAVVQTEAIGCKRGICSSIIVGFLLGFIAAIYTQ